MCGRRPVRRGTARSRCRCPRRRRRRRRGTRAAHRRCMLGRRHRRGLHGRAGMRRRRAMLRDRRRARCGGGRGSGRRPGGSGGAGRRERRAGGVERGHRQRRADFQAARVALHERLRIGVEQRTASAREHARIVRLRGRFRDVVQRLARLDRHGKRSSGAGSGRRQFAGADCPCRCGCAECQDRQRATHGARQTGLTRKQGNSGHRWLYRRAQARLGFTVGSVNKVAAEMQKRRAERDAFGGSVRRNRVVYFTRSGSGRIRRRQVQPGAG